MRDRQTGTYRPSAAAAAARGHADEVHGNPPHTEGRKESTAASLPELPQKSTHKQHAKTASDSPQPNQPYQQQQKTQSDPTLFHASHSSGSKAKPPGFSHDQKDAQQTAFTRTATSPTPEETGHKRAQSTAKEAYVTMVTTAKYVIGAEVLGKCLKSVGTSRQMVALIDTSLPPHISQRLRRVGWDTRAIQHVQNPNEDKVKSRPWFNTTFSKLHVFGMEEFDVVVFLDADLLVTRNIDELFDVGATLGEEMHNHHMDITTADPQTKHGQASSDRNAKNPHTTTNTPPAQNDKSSSPTGQMLSVLPFAAAPEVFPPDTFNSGVLVVRPSLAVYRALVDATATVASYDGSDQVNVSFSFTRTHIHTYMHTHRASKATFAVHTHTHTHIHTHRSLNSIFIHTHTHIQTYTQGFLNNVFRGWWNSSNVHRLPFAYNVPQTFASYYRHGWDRLRTSDGVIVLHFAGDDSMKPWSFSGVVPPSLAAYVFVWQVCVHALCMSVYEYMCVYVRFVCRS
jgi:lipopolysaccharide biosynthesis glycosyltransferase